MMTIDYTVGDSLIEGLISADLEILLNNVL
jgi:hypothetical protein